MWHPNTPKTPWNTPKHPPNDNNRLQVLELIGSFQGCWTQWQRFERSSMHHYWDTPHHFLKTHFCLESGFLAFLELQKSLLVTCQGCWTQWQRFESSSTHHFWDTPQHFLKTHFCLESDLLSFLELQKSLLVNACRLLILFDIQ